MVLDLLEVIARPSKEQGKKAEFAYSCNSLKVGKKTSPLRTPSADSAVALFLIFHWEME